MTPDTSIESTIAKITAGNGADISAKETFALLYRYPFFTLPAALLIKNDGQALPDHQRKLLTTRVALSASNSAELYMLLSPGNDNHASFYPDEADKTPTTENAIDTFLQTYGSATPEEEDILNKLIFNPTPDYSMVLAKEEAGSSPQLSDAAPGSDDDLINRFIISSKEKEAATPRREKAVVETAPTQELSSTAPESATPPPSAADATLSESLARIFIKQRQYQRAYEIIEQLNLNFPEKSVYFADQLRFLRKLIANEKLRSVSRQAIGE
ncbi:MAG: hypothetical protein K2N91_06830 [Muribaculaceae bacterium]|nr:hypothetical protein [Muribaculaceae bacterium]